MTPFRKPTDKSWRVAGTVAAVVVTTAAGGVAWATTGVGDADTLSPSVSPSAAPSNGTDPGRPGPGKGHRGHRELGMPGAALHGEFVTEKKDGGYQTVATQRGQVTEVSKESLTVKSADGYSRTYTLTDDTLVNAARDGIDDVKKGNTVMVLATVADGKATATTVSDGTVRKAARDRSGIGRGPR